MRKQPLVIALTAAGIIAGTSAGIAAISGETSNAAQPVAVQTAPEAQTTAVEAPVTQVTADGVAPGEAKAAPVAPVVQAPAESVVQPQWALKPAAEPQRAASVAKADEYSVRIPFTNRRVKVTVPTFPDNSSDNPAPPASLVAYFDRVHGGRTLVGAAGPVTPRGSGGDDSYEVSPSIVAHFDRIEARRMAAIKAATPAVAAAPVVTPDSPVASLSSTTASGAASPAATSPSPAPSQ